MSTLKKIQIGIIANSTSASNREELIAELGPPENGFFGPLEATYGDLNIAIIPLDIQPNDPTTIEGNKKGRAALPGAVEYLIHRGAEIIDFAASTKRLPANNGREMKEKYPDTVFTIGDNATSISLLSVIANSYQNLRFDPKSGSAACMGDGFMGRTALNFMLEKKCENLVLISRHGNNLPSAVRRVEKVDNINPGTQMFFSCAHNHLVEPEAFRRLLDPASIIIDVAAPFGISQAVYSELPKTVELFHAGSFFLEKIKYQFPPNILSFPLVGFWYGCFTEAVMLMLAKQDGIDLRPYNFFGVNSDSSRLLYRYLQQEEVMVPLINFYAPEKGIKFSLLSRE
ncbi:MAG: hypothetical protein WC467_04740 [Patescibacteria group bacterium]